MPLKGKIILFALGLVVFFFVLNLIIKRRLRIEHSILWLVVSLVIILMTVWQGLADRIAHLVGIDYPPSLFFAVAIFFGLLMLFHNSVEISKLKEQTKTLNQELSISRHLLEKLEKEDQPGQE
jgi:hypothetical protein